MHKKLNKRSVQTAIIVSSLLATGCEYMGPNVAVKLPVSNEVLEKPKNANDGQVAFKQLKNDDNEGKPATKPIVEQFRGTGQFVAPSIDPHIKSKSSEGKYSLNFDDADLGEVSKIILSDMLGENYVLNPAIAGKVTLQTTQPLSKEELLPTLEMLLRMNDVTLIKSNGIYRIEPNAKALQASGIPSLGKSGKALAPGYQTRIVPLRYIGSADMMDILNPLLPDKSVVRADPGRNILLISGTSYEIQKILEIVQTFDVNFMAGMSFGLYPLDNVDLTDAITQLEQIFNKEEKTPLSGMIRFVPIKHLNAVLIVTQQQQYLEEAKTWLSRLDKPGSSAAEGGFVVYRVQHVDATELAATLSSIVTGVSSPKAATPASTAPGQQTSTLTNKAPTQVNKKSPTSNPNASENELSGMQVIADEANNALVITAKPHQYRLVKKIIQELDVMPLQVLIDATIVSVDLTDTLKYGVKWLFEKNPNIGGDTLFGSGGGSPGGGSATTNVITAAGAAAVSGFTYGFLSSGGGPSVVMNALANNGNLNVLSSPSLMVLNNKEASIHVGNTIPFQSGTSLQTATNTAAGVSGQAGLLSQNTQIKTGVDLKVKPRVNANGIVIMEIEQKVNDAQANTVSPLTPTILERDIKSSVAVVSGETVVLGGLISESNNLSNEGIPWLKDLPLLGSLFSSNLKDKTRKELIVLITPRVVENKYDARKVAQEFKQKLQGIYYDTGRSIK